MMKPSDLFRPSFRFAKACLASVAALALLARLVSAAGGAEDDLVAPEGFHWKPFLGQGEREVFKVRDFGAVPDDSASDTGAILRCLDTAIRSGKPAEVVFETGRYVIEDLPPDQDITAGGEIENPRSQAHRVFRLSKADNLVLRGNGAVLELASMTRTLFGLYRCHSVLIDDLSLELRHDPFLAGTVISNDPATGEIRFALNENNGLEILPVLKDQLARKKPVFGFFLDEKVPGRLRAKTHNYFHVKQVESEPGRQIHCTLESRYVPQFRGVPAGARIVIWSRNGGGGFFLSGGSDVTVRKFRATRLNGSTLVNAGSSRLAVLGCEARIRPGQWVSQAADFVHCQAVRQGPWIQDCHVEGIGDDSLVIYTRPYTASAVPQGKQLPLKRMATAKSTTKLNEGELQIGDSLVFIEPSTGRVLGRGNVTAWNPESSDAVLDQVPAGVVPWGESNATQIFNENHGNEFLMRHNTVQNNRRYGIYIKAGRGIIEENRIIGQSSSAVAMQNEPAAPNGPFCHDIIVRNNVIEDCGFDQAFLSKPHAGVIGAYGINLGFTVAQGIDGHRNLQILNNRIKNWGAYAISLSTLTGARIEGNQFIGDAASGKGIQLRETSRVTLKDNRWIDPETGVAVPLPPLDIQENH